MEGISEGRQAAIAETKEAAIADAKAELADIVETFDKALEGAFALKTLQAEALSSSINAAILKLASERAGMQIDDMPDAFSNRINVLVTSIGQKLIDGKSNSTRMIMLQWNRILLTLIFNLLSIQT